MARDFSSTLAEARRRLAAGFTTKQAQKDAAFLVGCAFDVVRDDLHQIGHAEVDAAGVANWWKMPAAFVDMHNAMPFSPAHFSPKRAKLFAAYPEIVARGLECFALRAEIMAAPVVKPTSRPRTQREIDRDAKARTCQICGRPIFAETGLIAHHGYERPGDGWQTASCYGARRLPFEASKDALVDYIGLLVNEIDTLVQAQRKTAAEEIPLRLDYSWRVTDARGRSVYEAGLPKYDKAFFALTRANATDMQAAHPRFFEDHRGTADAIFDALKAVDISARAGVITRRREYLAGQRKRAAAWKQTERWNGGAWANV